MPRAFHWIKSIRIRRFPRFAVLLGVAMGVGVLAQQNRVEPAATLITGARLLDASAGRYRSPAAVLIVDGRIRSISQAEPADLPAGVRRLALSNATLVPGLIDARASVAPTADLNADYFHFVGLAHGVTGYRALNLRTTWAVAQRQRIDAGAVVAPRLWVSGRGFDRAARPDLWLFDASDSRLAASEAASQIAAKVDWLAGFENLTPDVYKVLVTQVKGTPVRVAGTPGASSMSDLAAAGVHAIEGLTWPVAGRSDAARHTPAADPAGVDKAPPQLAALAQRLVRARVTLVPMLSPAAARAFPDDAEKEALLAWLPDARKGTVLAKLNLATPADTTRSRRAWTAQSAFIKRFMKAGGRVVVGTGFDLAGYPMSGVGVHAELAALVRAGLPPADAIRAATVNAAAMLGADQTVGTLAPGRAADLVVVQGDPLANIGDLLTITHVIRRGQVFDPKVLRARARPAVGPPRQSSR